MIQFPFWIQVAIGVSIVIAQLATTAFVLFVLWPSIRNQERRSRNLEAWLGRDEVKKALRKLIDKIETMDYLGGKSTTRDAFASGSQFPGKGANDL